MRTNMKIKVLLSLVGVLSAAAAHGQNTYSAPGVCSAAGDLRCDHVTVAYLDSAVLLQFSEDNGHIQSFQGTADATGAVITGFEYFDGQTIGSQQGQCKLIYKKNGELSQVICDALTFTVTKDSK